MRKRLKKRLRAKRIEKAAKDFLEAYFFGEIEVEDEVGHMIELLRAALFDK